MWNTTVTYFSPDKTWNMLTANGIDLKYFPWLTMQRAIQRCVLSCSKSQVGGISTCTSSIELCKLYKPSIGFHSNSSSHCHWNDKQKFFLATFEKRSKWSVIWANKFCPLVRLYCSITRYSTLVLKLKYSSKS